MGADPAALRAALISGRFMRTYRRLLPSMSDTEREALEAGTVWWDGELFTGRPDWRRLAAAAPPALSAEEQAFLDGPCETLCGMLHDFDITHRSRRSPTRGMELPEVAGVLRHDHPEAVRGAGVLDFCALVRAHETRQPQHHLRLHGGGAQFARPGGAAEPLRTQEQKDHYLPRLARGEEIPCFALTGPRVGSDAAAIPDTGVVCRGVWQGREIVGLRLNFSKRYITLAPVATVVGLAFACSIPSICSASAPTSASPAH